MKLNRFLRAATPEERQEVACACNGSVGYLYLLAGLYSDKLNGRLPLTGVVGREDRSAP